MRHVSMCMGHVRTRIVHVSISLLHKYISINLARRGLVTVGLISHGDGLFMCEVEHVASGQCWDQGRVDWSHWSLATVTSVPKWCHVICY